MNHNEYVIKFNNKWQGEYEIIGTYLKSNLLILIKHNNCGRTYEKIASEALRYGCKECWMGKKAENLLDGGITKPLFSSSNLDGASNRKNLYSGTGFFYCLDLDITTFYLYSKYTSSIYKLSIS
jgi:hypothetical protein